MLSNHATTLRTFRMQLNAIWEGGKVTQENSIDQWISALSLIRKVIYSEIAFITIEVEYGRMLLSEI